MHTQGITPSYYQPLSPAQYLNQAAVSYTTPIQQTTPVYPNIPRQPVYLDQSTTYKIQAFDKYTKGHSDLAIQELEKSIAGKKLDNTDIDTLVILGRLYRETKQYEKSLNVLQQANNIKSSYMQALVNPMPPNKINFEIGKTYFAMGKIKEAKEFMQGEKILYEIRNTIGYNKEDEKDYNELTQILNLQA